MHDNTTNRQTGFGIAPRWVRRDRSRILALTCVAIPLVSLAHVPIAVAATYYVDAISGNDSGNGLTPAAAWQSLNRVSIAAFFPGDTILFQRDVSFVARFHGYRRAGQRHAHTQEASP